MKKLFLIPLIVVLLSGLISMGCSQSTPATTQSSVSTQTATSTAPPKVIELKFSDFDPPTAPNALLRAQWGKHLEARSGGKVKVTYYYGEALNKTSDTVKTVSSGLADLAFYTMGNNAGLHPLNLLFFLPFTGLPGSTAAVEIYSKLQKEIPALQNEFESTNTKLLWSFFMPPWQLNFTKTDVVLPGDLKGLKVMGLGPWSDALKSQGASLVVAGPPDWYMNLERGMVDGHIVHWAGINAQHTLELFKYHTIFNPSGYTMGFSTTIMNLDTWKSLPADVQQIVMDLSAQQSAMSIKSDAAQCEELLGKAKSLGHIVNQLTPEQTKQWADLFKTYNDNQIAALEAKGLPAKQTYDGIKNAIKAYGK